MNFSLKCERDGDLALVLKAVTVNLCLGPKAIMTNLSLIFKAMTVNLCLGPK